MQSTLLVISPTPTHPTNAGNRTRILNMMQFLMSQKIQIFFVLVGMEDCDIEATSSFFNGNFLYVDISNPPKKSIFKKIKNKLEYYLSDKSKLRIDDWYPEILDEKIKTLQNKHFFSAVMVEYVYMSKVLKLFGNNVLKIIDTHDVTTDRDLKFKAEGLTPSWFFTTKRQEAKGLKRADVLIAINQKEASFFKSIVNKKVIIAQHAQEPIEPREKIRNRYNLLFIASNNEINQHSIQYFISNIFPLILAKIPQSKLLLAGNISQTIHIENQNNIVSMGVVDDLASVYELADIVINPVQFGTGLKIKNIEALAFSKVLVTTSIGAEGLESGTNKAFLVCDSPNDFAESVTKTLMNVNYYINLQAEAFSFAKHYQSNCYSELLITLNKKLNK